MLNAPVEERIGGRNVYKKQYTEVEYFAVITKYFIMSYNSGFCLVNVQTLAVYLANSPSQLSWEGKLVKPKEEIRNLNGFEFMYLSNLKVSYSLYSSSVSIKVISMGATVFSTYTLMGSNSISSLWLVSVFWILPLVVYPLFASFHSSEIPQCTPALSLHESLVVSLLSS